MRRLGTKANPPNAWGCLVPDLPGDALGEIGQTVSLEERPDAAAKIIAGRIRGREIVDPNR